jgi:hypothetical protein
MGLCDVPVLVKTFFNCSVRVTTLCMMVAINVEHFGEFWDSVHANTRAVSLSLKGG